MLIKYFYLTILFFTQLCEIYGDCGRPGYSKLSYTINNNHRYAEGKVVTYACRSQGSSVIFGYFERKCENGKWLESIPKCGTKVSISRVKRLIRNEVLVVSTNSPVKLVGVRVRVSSVNDIDIDEVKHLPEPWNCTRVIGQSKDGIRKKSFIFTCVTLNVDMRKYREGNFIILQFTRSVECRADCTTNVDTFELFAAGRDNCNIPDRPLYGESRLFNDEMNLDSNQTSKSQSKIVHHFDCKTDFRLTSAKKLYSDECPNDGDWQYPKLPTCSPTTTCRLPPTSDKLIIDYTDLYTRNEYVIGGLIKYSCPDHEKLVGLPTQECLPDGTWTGHTPTCLAKKETTSIVLIFVSLLVFICLVGLMAFSVVVYRMKSNRNRGLPNPSDPAWHFEKTSRNLPKEPDSFHELGDPRYTPMARHDPALYDDVETDPNYDYIQPQIESRGNQRMDFG